MNIAYVRVSTIEQNEERQVKALKEKDIDKWYIEKVSAKDTNRPKFREMMSFIDTFIEIKGKEDIEESKLTVYIHDFSRLARSTKDLLEISEDLKEKGVKLVSLKENLDTSTANGKLMMTMLGAINEFERANMLERQKEGIAIAVEEGKYKGRKPMKINKNKFNDLYEEMEKGYITKVEMAEKLDISRSTLYRRLKKREEEKKVEALKEIEE